MFCHERDFPHFITWLIDHFDSWETYELGLEEYKRLLLNSWPYTWPQSRDRLATLEETVGFIERYPEYLEYERKDRGINGVQVARYLGAFRDGEPLTPCIVIEKDPDMRPEGSYYIGDGMHRLVAYGVYTGMREEFFPIPVVLGTGKIME